MYNTKFTCLAIVQWIVHMPPKRVMQVRFLLAGPPPPPLIDSVSIKNCNFQQLWLHKAALRCLLKSLVACHKVVQDIHSHWSR